MEQRSHISILLDQTACTPQEMRNAISGAEGLPRKQSRCGIPARSRVRRMLHAPGRRMIVPHGKAFTAPPFHAQGPNSPDMEAGAVLSRGQSDGYPNQVEAKINAHTDGLQDEDLLRRPEGFPMRALPHSRPAQASAQPYGHAHGFQHRAGRPSAVHARIRAPDSGRRIR